MPPIPIWRVQPGSMSAHTFLAMARSTSVAGGGTRVGSGSVASTTACTRPTWRKLSPSTRGIFSLTWTITVFAAWQAAFEASVSTPRLMKPCSSGRETCTIATSRGTIRCSKMRGIRCRKIGV